MTTLAELKQSFVDEIQKVTELDSLNAIRVRFLGKSGFIAEKMKTLGAMQPEERKAFGAEVNVVRDFIAAEITSKNEFLENQALEAKLSSEKIDITLPGREIQKGKVHLISQAIEDLKEIFTKLGFTYIEAQELEDDWHNFSALNIPEIHPARQMHDTFYLKDGSLLRTHTSNAQIRYLTNNKPPVRAFTIGKTYRSDHDATHSPMFHQIEVFCIDKDINMGHLKWTIETFLKMFYGVTEAPIRLRPSYFPFTEPSAEVDARCDRSTQGEIKIGEGNDWVELLGSGMIHPNVLKNVGVNSNEYSGFAFGAGVERLTMLKYNVPDLRDFYESDLRWLRHYGV
jgi:phenylalanyl-tRNA synthetase alpha chain